MKIIDPKVVPEVSVAFQRYQDAIIGNDVAVLNELFWDNALTLRYGTGENLYGHKEIAGYRSARNPAGLARVETRRVVTTYGQDYATTNIEFTRQGRVGRQSQAWVRMPEGWRIVAAHVSYMD